jgi:SAM-dependent methyltransferase
MGIRGVLAAPQIYEAWSRLVGSEHGRSTLVHDHVRPWPGARVLDLGCGPGDLVRHLGEVEYVGVDSSEEYIVNARRSYGRGAQFRVGDASALDADLTDFDIVIAFGLIHHLDDATAGQVFSEARGALRMKGRLIAVDPAMLQDDRVGARLLISWDRGEHVRSPEEYEHLARIHFPDVRVSTRKDLLRIPYSHCVLECGPDEEPHA